MSRDYFLGTIVLTEGDRAGTLEVADGQQRLATASILIAAIRDYLFKRGDSRYGVIESKYLIQPDLLTEELIPRLRLNVEDNDFFRKRVLALPDSKDRSIEPEKDSHKKIAMAADLAAKQVAELHSFYGRDAVTSILRWIIYLTEHARVISFFVPDHADAFMIFETLNDRGLELSKADLLKNFLFGALELTG